VETDDGERFDTDVGRFFGGTNEIMEEIIGRGWIGVSDLGFMISMR
jgi:hypothetical protein